MEYTRVDFATLTRRVRAVLSDDLRKKPYRDHPNKMAGHCYIAAEAIHHMSGGKYTVPQVMRVDGGTHWFLRHSDGSIFDPTEDQFDTPVNHSAAKGCGFLAKQPCKRTQEVIRRVNSLIREES